MSKKVTIQIPATSETVEIREFEAYEDFLACTHLQLMIWGDEFIDTAGPSVLIASQKAGGLLAGAFASDGEMVGFVYGLLGKRDDHPIMWSHMLAVHPDWRGKRLGYYMKEYQKNVATEWGIYRVLWTFDPLESVNANLNVNNLGALTNTYLRNVYGDGSTSVLHNTIGTDRFIMNWFLRDQDRDAFLDQFYQTKDGDQIVNVTAWYDDQGRSIPCEPELPIEPVIHVEIPQNIQLIKKASSDLAVAWRMSTRRAFEHYFANGYALTGYRYIASEERCFYLLSAPK